MKTRMALMVVMAAMWIGGAASGEDLTLQTIHGARYERVRVSQQNARYVKFSHAAGICTVPVRELTDASRASLGMTNDVLEAELLGAMVAAPAVATSAPTGPARAVCNRCRGIGTIRCPTCNGAGFGPERTVYTPCQKCGGTGKVRKQVVVHEYDRGAGKRRGFEYRWDTFNCAACKGAGKFARQERTYCPTCGGHKVIRCPECSR